MLLYVGPGGVKVTASGKINAANKSEQTIWLEKAHLMSPIFRNGFSRDKKYLIDCDASNDLVSGYICEFSLK